MIVKEVLIKDLIPAKYNPREMTEKEANDLKTSLTEFGMVEPIVVNSNQARKNIIIGGHQRYKILKTLGWYVVPVVYVDIADIKKEQELNLRLNKNLGHWDWDLLANFDEELLKSVGFDEELDRLFHSNTIEDEPPEVTDEPAISKYNEVYQLGTHRLMCGDSTKIEDVERLMDGKKADLIFTDPPYGVNYQSQSGNSYNKGKYAHLGTIFNDDKDSKENLEFFRDVLANLYVISKEKCVIYWWLAFNSNAMENLVAFKQTGWKMSQVITWVKDRFVFSRGQDFHRISEPCFFGWKEGYTHFTNKKINNLADVFNLDYDDLKLLPEIWIENRDKTTEYLHPTQKPVKLAYRALKKSSKIGDLVVDLFGGSGSTLSACQQSERVCYMMELDPAYCDVIRKRYANLIGKGEEWQNITKKL